MMLEKYIFCCITESALKPWRTTSQDTLRDLKAPNMYSPGSVRSENPRVLEN